MFIKVESLEEHHKWLLNTDNIIFIDIHNNEVVFESGEYLRIHKTDLHKLIKLLTKETNNA